jgi:hypothetical protein
MTWTDGKSTQAYPLAWPVGWRRTDPGYCARANFKIYRRQLSVNDGVTRVLDELRKLVGRSFDRQDAVISTNIRTRLDGFPRSDAAEPNDSGVAVYWRNGAETKVMAIDQYDRVADNLAAIAATIAAMRAIERHGGAQILNRAFAGFTALPAPGQSQHWRDVLGVLNGARDVETVKACYRLAASAAHPDKGGSHERMAAVNAAWAQAQAELGV